MKLTNIGKFNSVDDYIDWKIGKFSGEEKTFENLFFFMFSEEENIFSETSDGYRIKKLSYGDCKKNVYIKANELKEIISLPHNSFVGLYMNNSANWIEYFWAILMNGYRPLLMNMRLSDDALERIIYDYNIQLIISDNKKFSCETIISTDINLSTSPYNDSFCNWGDEVGFMSSGTSDDNVKLCFYTAENFYYQIHNSADIIKNCPQIAKHYNGELKLLVLLPLYHVFGFIAVYLWFGFFSRTFVFPKDLNPSTVQNTVKKHKVTHIFAVPLVWDAIHRKAMKTIENKGEKTYSKFCKGLKIANKSKLGQKIMYKPMGEVRDKIFGDSVKFLISGGSFISCETLEFFNGIGYHIANGYGMTEIGITSVDISANPKNRNLGSIGRPFSCTEYAVNDSGELLIKGKNTASRILFNKETLCSGYCDWFNSHDLATKENEMYFIKGRSDDLIVSETGENLNPNLIEKELIIDGINELCLIKSDKGPTLLLSAPTCYTAEKAAKILTTAKSELKRLNLETEIHSVLVTPDNLIEKDSFKLNRKKIAEKLTNNSFNIFKEDVEDAEFEIILNELKKELTEVVADVLQCSTNKVNLNSHFLTDLGASSLDYFMISDAINEKYGIDIKNIDDVNAGLYTVNEIYTYIKSR